MQSLTEILIDQGYAGRILSARQVDRLVQGHSSRRYGLVNRALKSRELIRIRRGLYVLPSRFRAEPPHPFAIAQATEPGSYVSLESALSFHGWIPEGVRVTASIVPGRKSSRIEHEALGTFTFHPLALRKIHFLELIERRKLGTQTAWVAKPLRALMDLVTLRKAEWQGISWLTEGLRIDPDALRKTPKAHIQTLSEVYQQKRPNIFLQALAGELRK